VLRMQIQPIHRLLGSQKHGQLQLCVPPVSINGPSYRLKDRASLAPNPNNVS
jgi:hypothetical protein